MGITLYEYANGQDNSKVASIYDIKELSSISHDITFEKNLLGESQIKFGVSLIAEEVGLRLRKMNKKAFTVHVAIKDKNLKVISKQITLKKPINLTKEIIEVSMNIIKSFWDLNKEIRMLSILLSNLVDKNYVNNEQISLFEKQENVTKNIKKQENLERAIDNIRNSFGMSSIVKANLLENDMYDKNNFKK